jgi:hypothetical protein
MFPADHDVISSGYAPSNNHLYPVDRWITDACAWVLNQVKNYREIGGELGDWRSDIGEAPFKSDILMPNRIQGWTDFVLDVVQATALRADATTGTFTMDGDVLTFLKKQNPGVFVSCQVLVKFMQQTGSFKGTWKQRVLESLAKVDAE